VAVALIAILANQVASRRPPIPDPTTENACLPAPSPREPDPDVEQRFRTLVAEWNAEAGPLSSMTARVGHRAYREIIALGPAVIPLVLQELEQRPNHWFAALRSLTGADPVAASDRGRIGPMTAAWLQWGRDRGYV
jgi:hypothetical protein